PSPASVSVIPGNSTTPVSFVVSALGAFNATVTLSCSGLPTGATCQFQPASVVPTSGTPASVTLNISTSSGTPTGPSQITITASTAGEPGKSQAVTLVVGAAPDYSLTIANPTIVGSVNVASTFNGTLTAANGYNSAVGLTCGSGAPPTCAVSPASVVPTAAGASFTVTVSSSVSQAFSFNIAGMGSDPSAITHSVPVTFTAMPAQNFDFTLGITPTTISIAPGQSVSFNIDVSPNTGAFPSNVTFSCSKLPALTTFAFQPTPVSSGSSDSLVTVSVVTTAAVPRALKSTLSLLMLALPVASVFWFPRLRSRAEHGVTSLVALLLAFLFVSCGGGLQGSGGGSGSPGTPPGTYIITITATSGSVTHSTPISLTVTP